MKLTNEVHIAGEPGTVFEALLDVGKLAGCMPGSTLLGQDGGTYRGEVKVKIGPLGVAYSGTVRFLETDHAQRVAVLKATGREQNGQGNADAHVTAKVLPDGSGSKIEIETDLMVRGKVAQFGRGVIGEVSQRLIGQFAENVEKMLAAGDIEPEPATASGVSEVDGIGLVVGPLLKRLVPLGAALALGALAGFGLGRRRRAGGVPVPRDRDTAWLLIPASAVFGAREE
jgi:carbon monoxide dehydrogenase subunit G